jgi:L-fuculose-phosphate aldolase
MTRNIRPSNPGTPVPRLDEQAARDRIVEFCGRMHRRGLIAGGEGNVSVRLGPDRILVTPSGVNKGFLRPSDLVVMTLDGRVGPRGGRASSEVLLHLAAYRARPEAGAVVHAHPPHAIALTLAGIPLSEGLMPESITALGDVPTAAYATPSTRELALGVERLLVDHDVVMMERHGSVCIGATLDAAYDRLESLEHTARIAVLARTLGPVTPLPSDEISLLRAQAEAAGLRPPRSPHRGTAGDVGGSMDSDRLVAAVVSEVLARLGKPRD